MPSTADGAGPYPHKISHITSRTAHRPPACFVNYISVAF
nr:MAG TPA: hypothetical protein [Caudoviricetes sp.]